MGQSWPRGQLWLTGSVGGGTGSVGDSAGESTAYLPGPHGEVEDEEGRKESWRAPGQRASRLEPVPLHLVTRHPRLHYRLLTLCPAAY